MLWTDGGDIWQANGFALASRINDILDREHFSLTELLDEDEVLQEVKSLNSKLICFLCREDVMMELLEYIITPAPTGSSDNRILKYPYMACEILCCEVREIINATVAMTSSAGQDEEDSQRAARAGSAGSSASSGSSGSNDSMVVLGSSGGLDSLSSGSSSGSDSDGSGNGGGGGGGSGGGMHTSFRSTFNPFSSSIRNTGNSGGDGGGANSGGDNAGKNKRPSTINYKWLKQLFSFLDTPGDLDIRLAGYFEKVLCVLLKHKCVPLCTFINSQGTELFNKVLRHLDNYSVMQVAKRLLLSKYASLQEIDASACHLISDPSMEGLDYARGDGRGNAWSTWCSWGENTLVLKFIIRTLTTNAIVDPEEEEKMERQQQQLISQSPPPPPSPPQVDQPPPPPPPPSQVDQPPTPPPLPPPPPTSSEQIESQQLARAAHSPSPPTPPPTFPPLTPPSTTTTTTTTPTTDGTATKVEYSSHVSELLLTLISHANADSTFLTNMFKEAVIKPLIEEAKKVDELNEEVTGGGGKSSSSSPSSSEEVEADDDKEEAVLGALQILGALLNRLSTTSDEAAAGGSSGMGGVLYGITAEMQQLLGGVAMLTPAVINADKDMLAGHLAGLVPHICRSLQKRLKSEARVATQTMEHVPKLGKLGLQLVMFVESLVRLDFTAVDEALEVETALDLCLAMIPKYERASLLHQSVCGMVVTILDDPGRKVLQENLMDGCQLPARLLDLIGRSGQAERRKESDASGSASSAGSGSGGGNGHGNGDGDRLHARRLGYVGHVLIMCQALVKAMVVSEGFASEGGGGGGAGDSGGGLVGTDGALENDERLTTQDTDSKEVLVDITPDSTSAAADGTDNTTTSSVTATDRAGATVDQEQNESGDGATRSGGGNFVKMLMEKSSYNEQWEAFCVGALAEATVLQSTPLGGFPIPSRDDENKLSSAFPDDIINNDDAQDAVMEQLAAMHLSHHDSGSGGGGHLVQGFSHRQYMNEMDDDDDDDDVEGGGRGGCDNGGRLHEIHASDFATSSEGDMGGWANFAEFDAPGDGPSGGSASSFGGGGGGGGGEMDELDMAVRGGANGLGIRGGGDGELGTGVLQGFADFDNAFVLSSSSSLLSPDSPSNDFFATRSFTSSLVSAPLSEVRLAPPSPPPPPEQAPSPDAFAAQLTPDTADDSQVTASSAEEGEDGVLSSSPRPPPPLAITTTTSSSSEVS